MLTFCNSFVGQVAAQPDLLTCRYKALCSPHKVASHVKILIKSIYLNQTLGHVNMSFATRFLLLFLLLTPAVNAEIISTSLFTLDVPNHWHVEDNKTSVVIATGSRVVDNASLPFLSIQYCKNGDTSTTPAARHCDTPCSKKSLYFLARNSNEDIQFSPITYATKPNGTAEYSVETTLPNNGSAFATLSCSENAQVYVSMVSGEARNIAKPMFEKIVSSLKWK
jgi:hypothetical protein